jgi:hypothetical protein
MQGSLEGEGDDGCWRKHSGPLLAFFKSVPILGRFLSLTLAAGQPAAFLLDEVAEKFVSVSVVQSTRLAECAKRLPQWNLCVLLGRRQGAEPRLFDTDLNSSCEQTVAVVA